MNKVLFIVKTQNLRNDQRVLKEINSLRKAGYDVEALVSKDCDCTTEEIGINFYELKIPGGAAPKNFFLRMIGALFFYIKVISFIKKRKFSRFWICDPILFGLTLLIKKVNQDSFIIWDHHELPPDWFFSFKFLLKFFKKAYISSNVVIHCNASRMNYLEEKLDFKHSNTLLLSNFPEKIVIEEEILSEEMEDWINNNKFIYLQNSLQTDRNGAQIIKALLEKGYNIFHAGKVNRDYLKEHKIENKKLFLAGYLSYKQINRVLNKALFTVVLYKMDNYNQIFCDPNRLYQSMNLGVPLIIGINPSMLEITKNYKNKLILKDDGTNIDDLKDFIENISEDFMSSVKSPQSISWEIYDSKFLNIFSKCAM